MASVGLAITNLQPVSGQTPAQAELLLGPQANATPANAPNQQQDTVTLTGRAGESQGSRTDNGGAQFAETAAFFFAESQTFRAGNGSGGNQTAKPPDVPQLPVKTTQEPDVQEAQDPADDAQGSALASAGNALTAPNASSDAPSSTGAAASNTPLAELAQLDTTLQEMNINPQSISLFNRMAMLLYANDPAALRVLIQTLQLGTQQMGANVSNAATGSDTSQTSSRSAVNSLLPGQPQAATTSRLQPQNGTASGQLQVAGSQLEQTHQASAGQSTVSSNGSATGTTASTVDMSVEIPASPAASQGRTETPLSGQFGELRPIFALVSGAGSGAEDQSAAVGQALDVTA